MSRRSRPMPDESPESEASQPHPTAPAPNGNLSIHEADDPHSQLVGSLRSQINDLMSQVTLLNGKLVQSYDRVSDLEDDLHLTSSKLKYSTDQISQLNVERAQHLDALNTGLLVERGSITSELTRLMERVTEEAAQRGEAENAKLEIEKDLDDLSATLFNQANTMVAEARFARATSERKAEEAESALRGAEEAVAMMQAQMQALTEEKETSERDLTEAKQLMGKGKWVPTDKTLVVDLSPKLSTAHLPYQEFLLFNSHIRTLRSPKEPPPPFHALTQLPFILRLQVEDSDPTLRLDFAPALNFLTRRSVQSAVLAGQLTIEPVATSRLNQDPTLASSMLGPALLQDLTCALCGKHVFQPLSVDVSRSRRLAAQATAGWTTTSRFLKAQLSSTTSQPSSPVSPDAPIPPSMPAQTYIFRVSLPPPSNASQPQKPSTSYPLCHNGFCIKRLRSTCELWHFVREEIVTRVWSEPSENTIQGPPPVHPSLVTSATSIMTRRPSLAALGSFRSSSPSSNAQSPSDTHTPTAHSSKKSVAGRVGSLWSGIGGALSGTGSRSASPTPSETPPPRRLPPPPPSDDTKPAPAIPTKADEDEVHAPNPAPELNESALPLPHAPAPSLPLRRRPREDGAESEPRTSSDVPSSSTAAESGEEHQPESELTDSPVEAKVIFDHDARDSMSDDGFRTPLEEVPEEALEVKNSEVVDAEEPKSGANDANAEGQNDATGSETWKPSEDIGITPKPVPAELPSEAASESQKVNEVEVNSDPKKDSATGAQAGEKPASAQPETLPAAVPPVAVPAPSAPPPVPRRAAARVARGQTTGSPTPSRSGTPVPRASVDADTHPTDVDAPSRVSIESTTIANQQSLQAPESTPEVQAEPPQGGSGHIPQKSIDIKSITSVASPSVYSSVARSPGSGHSELPDQSIHTSLPHPDNDKSLETPTTVAAPLPLPPPVLPQRRVPPLPQAKATASLNGHTNGDVAAPPPVPDRSDSIIPAELAPSWEEKTWKELVRLRENMFWARMGAVRPGSNSEEDQALS